MTSTAPFRPAGAPARVRHLNRDLRAAVAVPPAWLGWSPMTDTVEIPRASIGNPPTVELHLLDLAPAVPTPPRRGRTVRRLRALAAEMARVHIPAAWRSAVTVCGGLAAGLLVLAYLDLTHHLGALLLAAASTGGVN